MKNPPNIDNNPVAGGNYIKFFNNPLFSDVILKVGDTVFVGHKVILASCSNIFQDELSSLSIHTSGTGLPNQIVISDIKPVAFKQILKYIYGGLSNMDSNVNSVPVMLDILKGAKRYSLDELKDWIITRINDCESEGKAFKYFENSFKHPEIDQELMLEKSQWFFNKNLKAMLSMEAAPFKNYMEGIKPHCPNGLILNFLVLWAERMQARMKKPQSSITDILKDEKFGSMIQSLVTRRSNPIDLDRIVLKHELLWGKPLSRAEWLADLNRNRFIKYPKDIPKGHEAPNTLELEDDIEYIYYESVGGDISNSCVNATAIPIYLTGLDMTDCDEMQEYDTFEVNIEIYQSGTLLHRCKFDVYPNDDDYIRLPDVPIYPHHKCLIYVGGQLGLKLNSTADKIKIYRGGEDLYFPDDDDYYTIAALDYF